MQFSSHFLAFAYAGNNHAGLCRPLRLSGPAVCRSLLQGRSNAVPADLRDLPKLDPGAVSLQRQRLRLRLFFLFFFGLYSMVRATRSTSLGHDNAYKVLYVLYQGLVPLHVMSRYYH